MQLGTATQVKLGAEARLRIDRFLVNAGGVLVLDSGGMIYDHDPQRGPSDVTVRGRLRPGGGARHSLLCRTQRRGLRRVCRTRRGDGGGGEHRSCADERVGRRYRATRRRADDAAALGRSPHRQSDGLGQSADRSWRIYGYLTALATQSERAYRAERRRIETRRSDRSNADGGAQILVRRLQPRRRIDRIARGRCSRACGCLRRHRRWPVPVSIPTRVRPSFSRSPSGERRTLFGGIEQRKRAGDGLLRMVFQRERRIEDRVDRIADDLVDHAAAVGDDAAWRRRNRRRAARRGRSVRRARSCW